MFAQFLLSHRKEGFYLFDFPLKQGQAERREQVYQKIKSSNKSMGLFPSFFKSKITCPVCKKEFNINEIEAEILERGEGYIYLKHKEPCGAHLIWDIISGSVHEEKRI